jgi:hypothetical protein
MIRNSTNSIDWADKLNSLKEHVHSDKKDLSLAIEKLEKFIQHETHDPSAWRERGRLHEELCYLLVEDAILRAQKESGKQNSRGCAVIAACKETEVDLSSAATTRETVQSHSSERCSITSPPTGDESCTHEHSVEDAVPSTRGTVNAPEEKRHSAASSSKRVSSMASSVSNRRSWLSVGTTSDSEVDTDDDQVVDAETLRYYAHPHLPASQRASRRSLCLLMALISALFHNDLVVFLVANVVMNARTHVIIVACLGACSSPSGCWNEHHIVQLRMACRSECSWLFLQPVTTHIIHS